MVSTFDVCVRGRGIVAHAMALQLARQRLRVALQCDRLISQADEPGGKPAEKPGDVRAYALNAASRRLLEGLRCWPEDTLATPVLSMEVHGDHGGHLRFDARTMGEDALAWIVDVPTIENRLCEAVGFNPQIQAVEDDVNASLLVVCEGRQSATREAFGIDFDIHAYAQTAIAARVRGELAHGQCARQWFAGGEVLALLPLDGPNGHVCALVWSVAEDRLAGLMSASAEEFCGALQSASHAVLGALSLVSQREAWPLQVATAQRWTGQTARGSWALAGDAAHTVHPLAGQGLNLGLGDVAELARTLDTRAYWRSVGDPRLLRQYERARKAALATVGTSVDGLQRMFAHDHPSMQTLRNWGMQGFNQLGPVKAWVARRAMGL